jgi:SAM-dependent methyltransferase
MKIRMLKGALLIIDTIRFFLLTRKILGFDNYQPVNMFMNKSYFSIFQNKSFRQQGSVTRLDEIKRNITTDKNPETLIDFGANSGFFSLGLAEKIQHVYAVDSSRHSIDILNTICRIKNISNISTIQKKITPVAIHEFPVVDYSLVLSIWHHWVKDFGMDKASGILHQIFQNTNKKLFFDTGASELPSKYKYVFNDNEEISFFLKENLGGRVTFLQDHAAFSNFDGKRIATKRGLFCVEH